MIRDSSTRDGFTGTVSRDFRPKFFCLKHSTVSVYYTVFAKRKTVFACSVFTWGLCTDFFTMKRGRNCLYTLLILTILNGKKDQKCTAFCIKRCPSRVGNSRLVFCENVQFFEKKERITFRSFCSKKRTMRVICSRCRF